MSKAKTPVIPAAPVGVVEARQDAARQYMGVQEHSKNWKPLGASVLVRFMDLRTGMCRWPIGDPRQLDTFRFCGCKCSVEATYCDTHRTLAASPIRPRTAQAGRNLPLLATRVA